MPIATTGVILQVRARLSALGRREDGASIVEFSLFAPVLVFACLMMIDIGLALNERMSIDHALRSAAQTAMTDKGEAAVKNVLGATAGKNFTIAGETSSTSYTAGGNPLSIAVKRYCACPESRSVAVDCSTICSGPAPTFVFYRMSAAKTYDGVIIPSIKFDKSMQVQIR